MGGVGSILAFLVGGLLYNFGRITPFVFGSLVMLGAVTLVLLLVREPQVSEKKVERQTQGSFVSHLKEVLNASDRSGLLILLAILCWFLGFNALETWISSFGKFILGINEGRMA
ncbi:MAG TPA: MFS transporter, partial [Anaerolineales bacterium]|nr:MFS transporter [Anaerolineales bacterium]